MLMAKLIQIIGEDLHGYMYQGNVYQLTGDTNVLEDSYKNAWHHNNRTASFVHWTIRIQWRKLVLLHQLALCI